MFTKEIYCSVADRSIRAAAVNIIDFSISTADYHLGLADNT